MALCSNIERGNGFAKVHENLGNGEYSLVKADDLADLLQAKQQVQLQEQRVYFERLLDGKLNELLARYTESLQAQKADLEQMLSQSPKRKPISPSSIGLLDAQSPMSPAPPIVEEENHEHGNNREDAQLRQQYLDVCGWKLDRSNTSETLHTASSRRSRNSIGMDLVGFHPDGMCQRWLSDIVHTPYFQAFSAFLVLSNSLMIGCTVDLDVGRAFKGESSLPWETLCDVCFSVAFCVELILRILAERMHFFKGPGRRWNLFDLLVVLTGLVDILDVINFSLTYLRILRILRIVRVLRVIRIFRFFRELRMMALSIISCLTSLIWAFSLLLLVLFIFCMVLLEGARDYLRGDTIDAGVYDDLRMYYAGVFETLYTLLMSVSGGISWGEVAAPFISIHAIYGVAFTFFIIFVMFGLLNVLVGVFVQNTEAIAQVDKEFVIQEEMARKDSMMNQMRELFNEVDVDKSGTITWQELRVTLSDESMRAYFAMMEIETEEAKGLFQLLDVDESGEVAIEEFIMGCMRLKGAAKSIDLASLLYENKRLHHMLHRYMDSMSGRLSSIQAVIAQSLC